MLNPARFQSSYKNMLRFRPRCRFNGLYFLMASYIKRPTRDMWTELKPGTILEVRTTTCRVGLRFQEIRPLRWGVFPYTRILTRYAC